MHTKFWLENLKERELRRDNRRREDNIKMDIGNVSCGLDSPTSRFAGICGNDFTCSVKTMF
jgi:hypothetical protein